MGIFSKNKLIGTVRIKFYGEDNASVEYETGVESQEQREMDLVQVFAIYYAKILFSLNRSQPADGLIIYIQKAIQESNLAHGKLVRPNILATTQELTESKSSRTTKVYTGEYLEKSNGKRIVETQMSVGGEGYYAPTSVTMFLQWLIKNLSDGSYAFFLCTLMGMNQYYSEVGDYASMGGFLAAPGYGFDAAQEVLRNSGRV